MSAIMTPDFLSQVNPEIGLVPVADCYAGGVTSDVINMKHYAYGGFLIFQGAIEDTGVSNVVTVLACDDTTPTNTTAMAFRHRTKNNTAQWGALTAATSAGYNFNSNNTNANGVYWVEFSADDIEAAQSGYEYVQLSIAETANKTVTAGVLFFGWGVRYATAQLANAIT